MNLHDVSDLYPSNRTRRLNDSWLTAEDLERARDRLREMPAYRPDFWTTTAGRDPAEVPVPNFYLQHPYRRAEEIIRDVGRFRYNLAYYGMTEAQMNEQVAYRVSPEDYRVLQMYSSQENQFRGPYFDGEHGTMRIQGITVVPTR